MLKYSTTFSRSKNPLGVLPFMPTNDWYSVRSIVRSDITEDERPRRAFEERVVLFCAASFEEALVKGEEEAKRYCESWPHPNLIEHLVAFSIQEEELRDGNEVWSCIRYLDVTDEEFLSRVYDGEQKRDA